MLCRMRPSAHNVFGLSKLDWTDEAIVLGTRALGESSVIVDAFTRDRGRHLGLVRAIASQNRRSVFQAGNRLLLHWRARLSDQLGSYTAEVVSARAAGLMEDRDSLLGLNAVTSVLSAVLSERNANSALFCATDVLLDTFLQGDFSGWGALYVRWELGVLEALGFGLDLHCCAVTGSADDLRYVSPRSGRAVSGAAAAPYAERLLVLPPFLLGGQNCVCDGDARNGLMLTGHFLLERVLRPNGKNMPYPRLRLSARADEMPVED